MWYANIPPARSNGTAFDEGLQLGAWYRGSQAHSMVNFAAEGPRLRPPAPLASASPAEASRVRDSAIGCAPRSALLKPA